MTGRKGLPLAILPPAILLTLVLLLASCDSLVEESLQIATPAVESGQADDYVADVAAQINAARISEGVAQLAWSTELADAAQQHAQDMASGGFVSHTGSDGSDVPTRMARVGYNPRARGEIIVWASGGPPAAMDWWWNSPLHRSTMLGPRYAEYGVGIAPHPQRSGQHYYVVVFGSK